MLTRKYGKIEKDKTYYPPCAYNVSAFYFAIFTEIQKQPAFQWNVDCYKNERSNVGNLFQNNVKQRDKGL